MDVLASNDGRLYHEKVQRIRQLRPDMILLSGGIDGGTVTHVVELAEILDSVAGPKCLVLDPCLGGPLNLVVTEGPKMFQAHGVQNFIEPDLYILKKYLEPIFEFLKIFFNPFSGL